ncbi:(deoxy)nucleoside triphosphate pyrophosphohydrolase [Lacihabitans sp. CCS-44]|uniref:(deoxy)nucleoside triphosphate pyrophosphohydrolase n=1 Tax=Lacihabitans sp. CCS-44 TaxID=2487331 RepID=UPI0020CF95D0|nr:(deoxy)nucleoside triphosphate pyrophosphohydrolase [Lacihabitans sp. CCS-44]MCP9755616.1 (deoxy)nucleoside triphosphate pyrophosphohydrolase [Lacihabitans sp. CCS-44]
MTTVVCAVIIKENRILVTQRSLKMALPLKWEFPGGKLEQNEDEISCIKREIKEELNIEIVILKRLIPVTHKYPNIEINLIPYVVQYQSGELKLNEHINYKLLKTNELNSLDWAEADIPILKQITHI